MKLSPTPYLTVVYLWLAASVRSAFADILNATSEAHIESVAQVMILPSESQPDPNQSRSSEFPQDIFNFEEVNRSSAVIARKDLYIARGRAQQQAKFQSTPQILTLKASGTTEAAAPATGDALWKCLLPSPR